MSTNEQFIISHSPKIQGELDRLGIPWGAQWELARGESCGHWTWGDITDVELRLLVGLNAEAAPKVTNLMLRTQRSEPRDNVVWCVRFTYFPSQISDTSQRAEYDREQEAIAEDHDSRRGLGVYGDWAPWHRGSAEDWYGGRISQCAHLVEGSGGFKVHLDTPTYIENPTRFARFLGSRRMIRLSIPPSINKNRLRSFLAQKFVLCGRAFVALRQRDQKGGKGGKVLLIEVNEDFNRDPKRSEGDHRRLTLREFVRWHNPMELNSNQVRYTSVMTCTQLKGSL